MAANHQSWIIVAVFILALAGCTADVIDENSTDTGGASAVTQDIGEADDAVDTVTNYSVEIVDTYPHDPTLFTQGLEFVDDSLLESAGGWGRSSIRIYDPVDGSVHISQDVDAALFAEGITVVDDMVWQLTWQAEYALKYRLGDLTIVDEVPYAGEGWGLCMLDDRLVMSDGTDQLTFRDPATFVLIGTTTVELAGTGPINSLNELECVSGDDGQATIWANVWRSNTIFGIDPGTGQVTDLIDASALVPAGFEDETERVLNGIAVHPDTGRFWLTGKNWPVLYEVELREQQP